MKKTIYFVRHGQSEGNVTSAFQESESPLTSEGQGQVSRVAQRAQKMSFDVLISSPQMRAKQTALEISKITEKDVDYSDLFVERIKPTALEGKSYDDLQAIEMDRQWQESLLGDGPKVGDGETFTEVIARADEALAHLTQSDRKVILVVSHGFFIRTLVIRAIFGEKLTREMCKTFQSSVSMHNTGITEMTYWDSDSHVGWELVTYNDQSHLG